MVATLIKYIAVKFSHFNKTSTANRNAENNGDNGQCFSAKYYSNNLNKFHRHSWTANRYVCSSR